MTQEFPVTGVPKSAMGQIHDAIDLLKNGRFESAITVAHAAEGILPNTDKPHVFHKLKALSESQPDTEQGSKHPNDFANLSETWGGPKDEVSRSGCY